MNIEKLPQAQYPAAKRPPAPIKELPKHEPGLIRDIVERGAGVVGSVMRVPGSLISGLSIGGYQGARKGADADFEITPKSVATGLVASSALQSLAQGAITGYLLLGPVGSALSAGKEIAQSSVGLYLFVKGGSAVEMGKQMAGDIDAKVSGGEGGFRGGLRGAGAGAISAVRSGASTAYQENRGAASGVLDGLAEIPREFKTARGPGGKAWRQALTVAAGAVGAAMALPAGIVMSLFKGKASETEVSAPIRYATGAASAALVGAAAGSVFGPPGIIVGGAIGAVIGLLGPASKKEFVAGIDESVNRARANDGDMGSAISNGRRDLVQKLIVGTTAGARQGWDAAMPEAMSPSLEPTA